MINEKTQESLAIVEKDASFMKGIKEVIQNFAKPGLTREEGLKYIKSAYAFILHVLDFYVTIDMMDMDADLLRLCVEDPQKASKFRESLNDAALSLKQNYQYLCKDGTLYGPDGLPGFKIYYAIVLSIYLEGQESGKDIILPDFFVSFSELEFLKVGDDSEQLQKKLEHLQQVEFSITNIKQFIDNCFQWSDKISEYLTRMRANKTVYEINRQTLNSIHAECNGVVYYDTTADEFARAIMNFEKPSFHLKNKDCFYAVLYALYENMGPLSKREQWLNAVLSSFELDRPNYSSTVNRIKSNKTEKLNKFYQKIISILENF